MTKGWKFGIVVKLSVNRRRMVGCGTDLENDTEKRKESLSEGEAAGLCGSGRESGSGSVGRRRRPELGQESQNSERETPFHGGEGNGGFGERPGPEASGEG